MAKYWTSPLLTYAPQVQWLLIGRQLGPEKFEVLSSQQLIEADFETVSGSFQDVFSFTKPGAFTVQTSPATLRIGLTLQAYALHQGAYWSEAMQSVPLPGEG